MKNECDKRRFCRDISERIRQGMQAAGIDLFRGPVIVALSGGADSVALLAVLHDIGCDCRAAHCNFHLRGEESMRDMRHVQTLCETLGIDLYIHDFDVPAQMEATGESVEMACRTLRYRWFDELLDRERASYIAVGHHREDRAETFMLNLMRGAGLEGLTSMRLIEGNVIRPLLPLSRRDIERYLDIRDLSFVNDSTNAENEYRRNSLRNRVFPLLSEIFGESALDSVVKTVENLERSRHIYREAVNTRINRYYDGLSTIDLAAIATNEKEPALILFEILRKKRLQFHPDFRNDYRSRNVGTRIPLCRWSDNSGNIARQDIAFRCSPDGSLCRHLYRRHKAQCQRTHIDTYIRQSGRLIRSTGRKRILTCLFSTQISPSRIIGGNCGITAAATEWCRSSQTIETCQRSFREREI